MAVGLKVEVAMELAVLEMGIVVVAVVLVLATMVMVVEVMEMVVEERASVSKEVAEQVMEEPDREGWEAAGSAAAMQVEEG